MSVSLALMEFLAAGILVIVLPGLDTALVLRSSVGEGRQAGVQAAFGVGAGCLIWGMAVSLGLGALIAVSPIAFLVLKWAGAAYLLWVGANLLLRPRTSFAMAAPEARPARTRFWSGLAQNLLNPKACVFFVSFLPQFVPQGVSPTGFLMLLTVLQAAMNVAWLCAVAGAVDRAAVLLRRSAVVRLLDRLTGCVFVAFGLKLALARR